MKLFDKAIGLCALVCALMPSFASANIHHSESVNLTTTITQKGTLSLSTSSLNFGEMEPPESQSLNLTVNMTSASVNLYAQSANGGMLITGGGSSKVDYSLDDSNANTTIASSSTLATKTLISNVTGTTTYNYAVRVTAIPQSVFGTFTDVLTFTLEDSF